MSGGILGTHDLTGGVTQSIYACDTDQFTTTSLSLCNRHNVSVNVTVAITDVENVIESAMYIEYETELKPKGVLERSALIVPEGKFLTVLSSHSNVSAVAWGLKAGEEVSIDAITDATDSVGPVWVTPAVFETELLDFQYYLEATDPGNVTYTVTSGTLPTGVSLSLDGILSGNLITSPGAVAITFTATDESGNTSDLVATVAFGGIASGGTKIKADGYTIHIFNSNDDFVLNGDKDVELLMVGGGGGGGGDNSGGGGAGGVIYYGAESPAVAASLTLTAGTYPVVLGAGGSGSPAVNTQASNGGNTTFNSLTALGGGYGGTGDGGTGYNGNAGGSGGGGASEGTSGTAGAGNQPSTLGFGNAGGNSANGAGGGGGGAGGVGQAGNVRGGQLGGDGGAGVQYSISGEATYYAAGGNGGNENGVFNQRPKVNGIGGQTNPDGSGTVDAVDGSGSGGGGVTHTAAAQSAKGSYGSYGGRGIVIIRYT